MAAFTDSSTVLIDGPWTHRNVSANGVRLHVVEAGSGPLVLFLHGFPEFWWAWRHQLTGLADAGYRAVAVDLRGYGASDKPPRGYDAYTLAGDAAGLIRALGERDAMVVGHGWGGILAWTMGTLHPKVVRRLAILNTAHPVCLRGALGGNFPRQLAASRHAFTFQLPLYAESLLTKNNAQFVAQMCTEWAGPAWKETEDFTDAVWRYRQAMQIPAAAHCALEYYRWAVRSMVRPGWWRYLKLMRQPIAAPTLQLHGELDSYLLPEVAVHSHRYVSGPYEWRLVPQMGHFLPEEAPALVIDELLRWAKQD